MNIDIVAEEVAEQCKQATEQADESAANRLVELGEELHTAGGLELMQDVAQRAIDCDPSIDFRLNSEWAGIGNWLG